MNYLNNIITFVFTNILTLSLQAALVSLVVLFINRFFKKQINPRLSYLLWALVLIRLVIPVLPQSPISIFNVLDVKTSNVFQVLPGNSISADDAQNHQSTTLSNDLNTQNKSNSSQNDQGHSDTTASTPNNIGANKQVADWSTSLFTLLAYIWLSGSILIIAYLIYVNIGFAKGLKKLESISLPDKIISDIRIKTGIKNNISFVQSNKIGSPSVFGILKYTVLIPKGLMDTVDEKTLYNIILHEFAHIKRNDLLISWLSYVLCGLHWFNPVLWFSAFAVRRCQEVCADTYVLSLIDEEELTDYGQTLLAMSVNPYISHRSILVTAGINENKSALKDRIKNIVVFSKKKYRITFVGIVLFAVLGIFLCTSSAFYPKTPEQQMQFQNNIMMSVSSARAENTLQDINLEIHNYNKVGLWSCKLDVYDGDPLDSDSKLVYSKSSFRVGPGNVKSLALNGIDYENTYFKLSYTAGLSLFNKATTTIAGQLKAYDKTADINNWGAVTDDEISSFVKEKDITPLGITKIYDFYTIVLFEKGSTIGGSTIGYYELYKDTVKAEVIKNRQVQVEGAQESAVSLVGGTASGMYPYVNIVINDPAILALGDKIVIGGVGNKIATNVSGQRGHTIETRGLGDINKILIYDKSDKLIYDGTKSLLSDVSFKSDDPSLLKVINEDGMKILNQEPINAEINFTSAMFPHKYVIAYQAQDIDLKIPLLKYKNSTLYLKGVYEANGGPEYLYACMYFIHDIKKNPAGDILGSFSHLDISPLPILWNILLYPENQKSRT
ncbi:MAG TPA: M56 family metallopeptidase [Ruminiclostridium sp.]